MEIDEIVRSLNDLLGEGGAYGAAGHILVVDGATGAIYTEGGAAVLAQQWAEGLAAADALPPGDNRDYQRGQAYSLACAAVPALREEDVPDAVVQALREESLRQGRLTWGW